MFDNTKAVRFHEKDNEKITAIISKEDEVVELEKPVMAQGKIYRLLQEISLCFRMLYLMLWVLMSLTISENVEI